MSLYFTIVHVLFFSQLIWIWCCICSNFYNIFKFGISFKLRSSLVSSLYKQIASSQMTAVCVLSSIYIQLCVWFIGGILVDRSPRYGQFYLFIFFVMAVDACHIQNFLALFLKQVWWYMGVRLLNGLHIFCLFDVLISDLILPHGFLLSSLDPPCLSPPVSGFVSSLGHLC